MTTPSGLHQLARHHHFRAAAITPSDRLARIESTIVNLLLSSPIHNDLRDSSIEFELKHSSGVTQCSRILARRRDLDEELSATAAALHDIAVIVTGRYEDHAARGEKYAREILTETRGYSRSETEQVISAIVHHSQKELQSSDAYVELVKDADVLDCFLYPGAVEEYFLQKDLIKAKAYLSRAKQIWNELGLPAQPEFFMLDSLEAKGPWMPERLRWSCEQAASCLADAMSNPTLPPFAIRQLEPGGSYEAAFTSDTNLGSATNPQYNDYENFAKETIRDIVGSQWTLFWPAIGAYQVIELNSETHRLLERG